MGVVCWSPVLVPSPGVGVGVRVCLARQLWALSLGSHRRTVLRKGWGLKFSLKQRLTCAKIDDLRRRITTHRAKLFVATEGK